MLMMSKMAGLLGSAVDTSLKVQDVFAATTFTGTGGGQAIFNGIDFAGKGGLAWFKDRGAGDQHFIVDTYRNGGTNYAPMVLDSSQTGPQVDKTAAGVSSWNSNGVSISGSNTYLNYSGIGYVLWAFRKSAKFFDMVTWSGTGIDRTLPHNLGVAPGMLIVKDINHAAGSHWFVYHRSLGAGKYLSLQVPGPEATNNYVWNAVEPTSTHFTVDGNLNDNGHTYIAYLFAHDPDGIIQCGSFSTSGSGTNATVTLGWEPQFLIVKRTNASDEWFIFDTARGWGASVDAYLMANRTYAENYYGGLNAGGPTPTGFTTADSLISSGGNYVYMAIRKP